MLSSQVGVTLLLFVTAAGVAPVATAGHAQELASRKPRFLAAWALPGKTVEMRSAEVLLRRVSLELGDVTVDDALKEITRQADLEISYTKELLPKKLVSLHVREITVAAALMEVLLDAGLDIELTRTGQMAVVRRSPEATLAPPDTGAIAGRVTDRGTGAPLVGATVTLEGTRLTATTNNEGRYRLERVAEGTYTLRARYIGYTPATAPTTVSAGAEAQADFVLVKSVQQLDQVVVTGTVVPTEVKALPTPVSVITESEIAVQQPHTTQELFRQAVPGAVSWDYPAFPSQTPFSVRGASTLSSGFGQMKVLIDGIEAAFPTVAPVDPSSIERIEVLRGPQAAAIYGSDAIGGVIQIFTKRGDPSLNRPQVDLQAGLGAINTPYAGYGGVLRQDYRASIRGGGRDASYSVGAGYSHTGDYLPNGELSAQSNPSFYGGMRFSRGIVSVDVAGRFFITNAPNVFNPQLVQTGLSSFAKPNYQPVQVQSQTIGMRIDLTATRWWRNELTLGIDRSTQANKQLQPRLTTSSDTLLLVLIANRTKNSVGFNSSLYGSLAAGLSGSLTVGFDHYSLPADQWFTVRAVNTTGTIQTVPAGSFTVSQSVTNNTGYFAQLQLGFDDVLFATAGLRAEQNSDFGDSLTTPLSPRAGLSYVPHVGAATLKFRASYGRAIRAPSPGQKFAFVGATSVVLENPVLGPERQHGWDAGVDLSIGSQGALGVTYYNQTADDLIQQVQLPSTTVPTFQFQNVGRVRNTGVELEGALSVGPLKFRAQYGYARARIEELAPNYTGDLRVGDQALATPKQSAGASLSLTPLAGMTATAGLTYVGSWNYYDVIAQLSCFGQTGPCQPANRDYIVEYPGFVKLNASVSQQFTKLVSAFVSIDNLANNTAFEFINSTPVMGRITTVGVRFRY